METIISNNILPIKYKTDRSNFHLKIVEAGTKYETEYIEYVTINDEKIIKYNNKLGNTVIELLNKFDTVIKTLTEYKNKISMKAKIEYNEILSILENLKQLL